MTLRIENAIDLHCHFGPDHIGGTLAAPPHQHSVTAIEAAREAAASGHAALVLKSHSFASPQIAGNVETLIEGLRCFGGICTDYPSGGLRAESVQTALALGARIVWLPTVNSREDHKGGRPNRTGPGIAVIDEAGEPLPVVYDIFDMVREKDAILATGHITAEEHHVIAKTFGRRGKVLVTHAGEHLAGPKLTADQCRELADLGATIEFTALCCQTVRGITGKSPTEMARYIHRVGPACCTLGTDYGWSDAVPRPAPGLRDFLEQLWKEGIAETDLQRMVSENPASLLGLAL